MAVDNLNTVDGIGKGKELGELVLLIADHMQWQDEKAHLNTLQDKINAYAGFIESNQYQSVYPGETFSKFLVQIMFLHAPTERAKKFLEAAQNYLQALNVQIVFDTVH